jgi:hypothetical protein
MSAADPRLASLMAEEERAHAEFQAALDKVQSLEEQLAAAERELPVLRVMASGSTRVRVEYVEQLADAEWEAGNRRR